MRFDDILAKADANLMLPAGEDGGDIDGLIGRRQLGVAADRAGGRDPRDQGVLVRIQNAVGSEDG
jgi:hypothetical protein